MSNVNPFNIRDGEEALCVGGPINGETRQIKVLFPFLNGGIVSKALTVGHSQYALDQAKRQWIYAGPFDGSPVTGKVRRVQ